MVRTICQLAARQGTLHVGNTAHATVGGGAALFEFPPWRQSAAGVTVLAFFPGGRLLAGVLAGLSLVCGSRSGVYRLGWGGVRVRRGHAALSGSGHRGTPPVRSAGELPEFAASHRSRSTAAHPPENDDSIGDRGRVNSGDGQLRHRRRYDEA